MLGGVIGASSSATDFVDQIELDPSIQLLLGVQYGSGINYGFGAMDSQLMYNSKLVKY